MHLRHDNMLHRSSMFQDVDGDVNSEKEIDFSTVPCPGSVASTHVSSMPGANGVAGQGTMLIQKILINKLIQRDLCLHTQDLVAGNQIVLQL
jgi:hypothetical protein